MSIVPDKKNGKLTGRFRVQVMVNYQLFRRRVDTIGEARSLEKAWLEAKAQGLTPPEPTPTPTPPPPRSPVEAPSNVVAMPAPDSSELFSKARQKADNGRIWKAGSKTERGNLAWLGFMEELMGDVELNSITTRWVLDLQDKLRDERGLADGSLNRYFACLSKFLKWATDMEYRTVTTLPKFPKHKEAQGRIRWFSLDEEPAMLALLPERSAKLVRLALMTGGRRAEYMVTDKNDVHPDRIIFWGDDTKSGKSRMVPLNAEGYALAKWLYIDGNMPTNQQLRIDWDAMRATNPEWEADEEFVFHGCRHTFATRAVEAGVPIRTLQVWLGHETIAMTERYAKVSGKALDSAMELMFGEMLKAA